MYNPPPVQHPPAIGEKVKDAGAWVKDYSTALKHGRLRPFTMTERKTRAATRNEPW